MRLYVVTERKYTISDISRMFEPTDTIEDYDFYERYLEVFDEVVVVARCFGVSKPEMLPSRNPRLHCLCLPSSPLKIVLTLYLFRKLQDGVLLIRFPGLLSWLVLIANVGKLGQVNLEVVTDPLEELLADFPRLEILRSVLRAIVRAFLMKTGCKAFVTKNAIQDTLGLEHGEFNYSSVIIPKEFIDIDNTHVRKTHSSNRNKLLFVGQLDKNFKRLDRALEALNYLPHVELTVVGDGRLLTDYKQRASIFGERVRFLGAIFEKDKLFCEFQRADVFVLTSVREGLPRVVIEAMACGLPVVAYQVSGVKELISKDCIVTNCASMVTVLERLLSDDDFFSAVSEENLRHSKNYNPEVLSGKRRSFYVKLRDKYENTSHR